MQLSRLTPAFENADALYVTTLHGAQAPSGRRKVAVVRDASRTTPLQMILLVLQLAFIVLRFRPQVVVSTGAAPGLLALRLSKLIGARTIWIDSIANSEELSLSGRLAGGKVDLWLTQWPHLVSKYPGLQYYGAVL